MSETTMPQGEPPLRKVTELVLYDMEAIHLVGALLLTEAVMQGHVAIAASSMLALHMSGGEEALCAVRQRLIDARKRGGA